MKEPNDVDQLCKILNAQTSFKANPRNMSYVPNLLYQQITKLNANNVDHTFTVL